MTITESTSIDYDVHGEGPAVVLIGGLGFGRWGWFRQVPALSRHFRVVTFDVRGERGLRNGVEDLASDVVDLIDHLKIKKAHVVGTSLGGFVAQELALRRPDLVDRLVLICTSYGGRGPEAMSPLALADMVGWGSFSPEGALRRGLETATSDAYRAEHANEFEKIIHWRSADAPSFATYFGEARAGASFDLSRDVEHITSPTLVIHGAGDRYVPPLNAQALADAIPDSRLRILDNAGHLVFIERFAEVNREIVTFLKPRNPKKTRDPQRSPETRTTGSSGGWLRAAARAVRRWIQTLWRTNA